MKRMICFFGLGFVLVVAYLGLVIVTPDSWVGSALQRLMIWFSICLTNAHNPSPLLGYSGVTLVCFGLAAVVVGLARIPPSGASTEMKEGGRKSEIL